jgi:GNAT superfamily N-acetyltransferase
MTAISRGVIRSRVTYLEMTAPPPGLADAPRLPEGFETALIEHPQVGWYRDLYDRIGAGHLWTARKLWTDAELAELLNDPGVEVYSLRFGEDDAGYVEFDFRDPKNVELAYFGILPRWQGRGLGAGFLAWAVRYVWKEKCPERLWLHTDALDHPAARHIYLKNGFRVFKEQDEYVNIV